MVVRKLRRAETDDIFLAHLDGRLDGIFKRNLRGVSPGDVHVRAGKAMIEAVHLASTSMGLSSEELRGMRAVESQIVRAQAIQSSMIALSMGMGLRMLPPSDLVKRFLETVRDDLSEFGSFFNAELRVGVNRKIVECLGEVEEGRVEDVLRDVELDRVMQMSLNLNMRRVGSIVGRKYKKLYSRIMTVQSAAGIKLMAELPELMGFAPHKDPGEAGD
jgi:hypothetical protein